MSNNNKITVMVVDDSAVIRGMITRILEKSPDIDVIASAQNGEVAVSLYKRRPVDIIILDVEMPVMDGITALGHIMAHDKKAKVIMCSTLTHANAEITLRAMALGAADYIPKPTTSSEINNSEGFQQTLIRMVQQLNPDHRANTHLNTLPPTSDIPSPATKSPATKITAPHIPPTPPLSPPLSHPSPLRATTTPPILRPEPPILWKARILAVSASTGGPQALFSFLKPLNDIKSTPIVLTQHMPATFTALLAKHISAHTGLPAVEAEDQMPLLPGQVHVARGGLHMLVEKGENGTAILRLNDGPAENYCKPAADPMLRSLIPLYGSRILSVVLTGMGNDATKGCADIVQAGGFVAAQTKQSSVVWGMPGSVATHGLACKLGTPENLGLWARQKVS